MSKTIEDLHWIFGKEKFESFSPDVKAKAIVLYNNDTPGDWDELLKLRYEEPIPSKSQEIWRSIVSDSDHDEFKNLYLGKWDTIKED